MFINAILNRKEFSFETECCKIEKIIKLTEEEYIEFTNNMIKDYEFITQNRGLSLSTLLQRSTNSKIWSSSCQTSPEGPLP